jgi:uncharacterized membrane protein
MSAILTPRVVVTPRPSGWGAGRRAAWGVMTLLALLIVLFGLLSAFVPEARSPVAVAQFAHDPLVLYLHIFTAAAALLIGPFQLDPSIRRRFLKLHKVGGRVYVVSVVTSAAAGLILAPNATGGAVSAVGFGGLALGWLATTALAVSAIKDGDVASHRRWMIRSYALTFAAVMLRIYLPVSGVIGLPFEGAYRVIAWLCWVPNLFVAEWFIGGRGRVGGGTTDVL